MYIFVNQFLKQSEESSKQDISERSIVTVIKEHFKSK